MLARVMRSQIAGYVFALIGTAGVTAFCELLPWRLHNSTVALVMILNVLLVAIYWGSVPGLVASVFGVFSLNYFFLVPRGQLIIQEPEDFVDLAAFLATALTVGQLSVRAKRRAVDAEAGRREARRANTYNRSLLEASVDPLVAIGKDGKITDVNPATEAATGRSRTELLGTDFSDYFTDPAEARAGYQKVFREGIVRNYELEVRHLDGHETPVLYNASVYRDEAGEVAGVFAAARDITERRKAEIALRESEANLRKAQAIAHIGSWHLDIVTKRLTWSDEVFRVFGVPKDQTMTYEDFIAIVHPEDRGMVEQEWADALQGLPYDVEHRILVGERVKWVRERAHVEFDQNNQAIRGIGTVQDITERKVAEEAIRRLNAELELRVRERTAELQVANRVKDELLVRERAATAELEQAREREAVVGFRIQKTLLLDQPPTDVPGLRVAALTIPSQRVDGDFYIFFKHRDQCLDVILGDVMGKGVPAALLGAATKSHFLKALGYLTDFSGDGKLPEPREVVMLSHTEVARQLIELGSFVTLIYARLDVRHRRLDLVDCGHTGMVHVHGGSGACELVHGDNLPLGVREAEVYEQISVPFEPGDTFFFYSDGITEARNPAGELFGPERLRTYIQASRRLEPGEFIEAIRQAVVAFSERDGLTDDLTSVVVRVEDQKASVRPN